MLKAQNVDWCWNVPETVNFLNSNWHICVLLYDAGFRQWYCCNSTKWWFTTPALNWFETFFFKFPFSSLMATLAYLFHQVAPPLKRTSALPEKKVEISSNSCCFAIHAPPPAPPSRFPPFTLPAPSCRSSQPSAAQHCEGLQVSSIFSSRKGETTKTMIHMCCFIWVRARLTYWIGKKNPKTNCWMLSTGEVIH